MAATAPTTAATGVVHSVSAQQNTQREYETVTILKPDTGKQQISDLIGRMQGILGERSGRLIKIDSWGMRVLAYPVAHQRKGIYLYWRYLGGSDMVAEFERHMRLSDRVIRFYTIRIDENVDPDARPSEVTDELLDAVSEPGPDPDELARQAAEEEEKRRAAAAAEAEKERLAQEAAAASEASAEPEAATKEEE